MERILIIDDEPMNLKLTKFILDNAGYEVLTTTSGRAGIELLQELHFDLLLLDIEMPEMGGLDVLRVIRGIPEIAGLKVVFLTASNSREDLKDAARLHAGRRPVCPEALSAGGAASGGEGRLRGETEHQSPAGGRRRSHEPAAGETRLCAGLSGGVRLLRRGGGVVRGTDGTGHHPHGPVYAGHGRAGNLPAHPGD